MNCQSCDTKLKVVNTYSVPGGKTQRLECPACFTVYTAAVVLLNVDPKKGDGASALAKRLTEGRAVLTTTVEKQEQE